MTDEWASTLSLRDRRVLSLRRSALTSEPDVAGLTRMAIEENAVRGSPAGEDQLPWPRSGLGNLSIWWVPDDK